MIILIRLLTIGPNVLLGYKIIL